MPVYLPGLNQQTAATLQIIRQGMGTRSASPRRKRRKRTKTRMKRASRRKTATSRKKKPARLVKGSAAAKAYMKKIRRKRK